jgi:hypothetical protein
LLYFKDVRVTEPGTVKHIAIREIGERLALRKLSTKIFNDEELSRLKLIDFAQRGHQVQISEVKGKHVKVTALCTE